MNKKLKIFGIIYLCLIGILLPFANFGGDCKASDNRDGVKGCKMCGRPVVALGYCSSCYKDFYEFTYGDD